MKKVVFLTMVFGLMMVFSGSISAHERPGKVDDNCAGVTPKKGIELVSGFGVQRGKATVDRGAQTICTLTIDVGRDFRERWKARYRDVNYYDATVTLVNDFNKPFQKGYLVKWQPTPDADFYHFTTADGKTEACSLIAKLDDPKRTPR